MKDRSVKCVSAALRAFRWALDLVPDRVAVRSAVASLAALLLLNGCASRYISQSQDLQSQGQYEKAAERMREAQQRWPDDARVRTETLKLRDSAIDRLSTEAQRAMDAGNDAVAQLALRRALTIDPNNEKVAGQVKQAAQRARSREAAARGAELLAKGQVEPARSVIDQALRADPRSRELLEQRDALHELERKRRSQQELRLADRRPISLAFRDANLRMVLEAITRATGLNFVLDRDVRPDLRATIFLKDATVDDALDLLTSTNLLARKTLDSSTVLLYPNTAEKQREHQDLIVRGFYLTNLDAKQAATSLRSLLKLREVLIDERLNMIVIREPLETVRVAERLIGMLDLSEPEAMLEVEVLEVKRSTLLNLGIEYPNSVTLTPLARSGGTQLTLQDLADLSRSTIGVAVPDVTVNLRRQVGDSTILANPRIRTRNREKARILIGDKVPVITSTSTSTGFVSENVTYLDVGLKLEVEPTIYLDDQVAVRLSLEVSSIAREIALRSGLAYQIGTRNASTVLRLRDGETQFLAGLLSTEERMSANRIPGIGDLPLLGRLFSTQRDSNDRTEIVLSITPRIVRSLARPTLEMTEFYSGTETTLRSRPPLMEPGPVPDVVRPADAASGGTVAGPNAVRDLAPSGTAAAVGDGAARLTLEAPKSLKVGEEGVVLVKLTADRPIRGLPFQLAYDPNALEVLEVGEGKFFGRDGSATNFSHSLNAALGQVSIGVIRSNPAGLSGSEDLVRLRVKALKAGAASVAVVSAQPIGLDGGLAMPAAARVEIQ